jgi:ribosomal-protein-alanine N-acetyltransferase
LEASKASDVLSLSFPERVLMDDVVLLRSWQESDLRILARASSDDYISFVHNLPVPFTEAAGREWIAGQYAHVEAQRGWTFAVVELTTNEPVGGVGILLRYPPGIGELAAWVVAEKRNTGIGERSSRVLCLWALAGTSGVERIEAVVEPWNLAAQRVLEKLGFVREGLLRSYAVARGSRRDAVLYSLIPGDLIHK